MSARSLFQIAGGRAKNGHRTGQPVRRSSYRAGEREQRYWRPFNKAERNARMRAAEVYDRKYKIAGKRNGPPGAIGVDVLRELMRMIDFKTGRLEPAIATLAERLRRSRGAIVSALARLKDHGFINWIRRFEPIEDPDVREVSRVKPLREHFKFVQHLAVAGSIGVMGAARALQSLRQDLTIATASAAPWTAYLQTEDGEPFEDDTGTLFEDAP